MKKLIKEEFRKFKASKLLMGLFMVPIVVMMVIGFINYSSSVLEQGYIIPISTGAIWMDIHFFLYGLIVIKMVASEFGSGVVGDSIRAGVDRKQYFLAKCITIAIITAVSELLMSLVLLSALALKYGIEIGFSFTIDFVLKFLMHYLIMVLLLCVMNAIAMLISYICKGFILSTIITFVLFVIVDIRLVAITLESAVCGPLCLIVRMVLNARDGIVYIFMCEFWLALIPNIIIGALAVIVSYIVFMKQKFATVEEREGLQ